MLTIHMLPARYGDSLVICMGAVTEESDGTTILIDCSFNYNSDILPMLKKLTAEGRSIDRFIITHFDDDHIRSAARLIVENGRADNPQIIPIKQIWLNTYRHLQFDKAFKIKSNIEQEKLLKNFIVVNSGTNEQYTGEISANQAMTLGKEILKFGYIWNEDFEGKAVSVSQPKVTIGGNVQITILSPTEEKLKKLEKFFEAELKKMKIELSESELVDDAFELFALREDNVKSLAYTGAVSAGGKINRRVLDFLYNNAKYSPDDAAGNGSSIAFILENEGKRLLFLADAHAETVIGQLKLVYGDNAEYPLYFDAVKVAHHGSFNNNSPELFQLIDSPHFLISTNGGHPSHKHPDKETLAQIVCRPLSNGITKRTITFNYKPDHLEGFFDEQVMNELNYVAVVDTKAELK